MRVREILLGQICRVFVALVVISMLGGCLSQDEAPAAGTSVTPDDGVFDKNHEPAKPVFDVVPIAPGAECRNGGVAVLRGLDRNRNDRLDPGEVTSRTAICSGSPGADGFSTVLTSRPEAAGANCPAGGYLFSWGQDRNRNNALDTAEVQGSVFVCHGSPGEDGAPAVVTTEPEPSGARCPAGGQIIRAGADLNRNGQLDTDEVLTTAVVCNGVPGPKGDPGDAGPPGLNSLITSDPEPAGANCEHGGIRVRVGLDTDRDGVLSDAEVTQTQYVCNGAPAGGGQPVARNDTFVVTEDSTLTVNAPGVLGNDTDPNGDPLTAVLVTSTTNGTLSLNADGSFSYAPNPNFNGSDSFTYMANDGSTDSNVATVTLNVTAVNDAPFAADDSFTTAEDTPLIVSAPGVLGNDVDLDGPSLFTILISGPANGTLVLNANGSFTYQPNANFNGTDSFRYRANDCLLSSNVAIVTINVVPVNDAPIAVDDAFTVLEDTQLIIAAPGVLANDVDLEGGPLRAVLVSGPSNGTLVINNDGSFTYTPDVDFSGPDSFVYRAADPTQVSNTATVSISVLPVP